MEYKFGEIEEKWKKIWAEKDVYKVTEDTGKPKFYVLDMFPYPSGAGLHVGHPLGYVASDIYARYKKLKGFNVLHPMGYDAFGLPAEQYAIETGTHPAITTEKAIARYRSQYDKMGFNYDWSRAVKTSEPAYYKWTQWIFLKLFKSWYNRETNKAESIDTLVSRFATNGTANWAQFDKHDHAEFTGAEWKAYSNAEQQKILMHYRLAFLSYAEVNWCAALGTVLANDEVKDGKSERGGYPVERKKMRQWFLRITEYSDRLLEGLERIDWSESMKEMQRNWIGRSEGALVEFKTKEGNSLVVFTTRPDTIFGATFMVISAEHELVPTLTTPEQKAEVDNYLTYVKSRTDVERQQEKKVTGVFTGSYVTNPFNGQQVPVWIAEYVLSGYGTGAIMAVPADDERDRKFAEKFNLPIVEIIDKSMYAGATIEDKLGKMINSEFLNGMEVKDAIQKILQEVEARGIGKRKVNYRQRDAGFSRQRYWGEPFPIKFPAQAGDEVAVALDEAELPLVLPDISSYKSTGDGKAPLANSKEWVAEAYETDIMPGYAGSSWYFFRYMDALNDKEFAAKDKLNYWGNVDLYLGGTEHAVGHLLYARFWTKFLFDLGLVKVDEPFQKLVNQGMIQGVSKFVYRSVNDTDLFVSKGQIGAGDNGEASELHVDVTIVKDDKLNIEAFKKWRPEYANARFVLEEDGSYQCGSAVEKMSKSKYNVVNPDDVIAVNGADCFRIFEMFLGPIEQSKPWDEKGINGVSNFLRKFWRMFFTDGGEWKVKDEEPTAAEYKILYKAIKKVAEDIERLSFNTAVSAFMICTNELSSLGSSKKKILEPLLIALHSFAPFITEELWQRCGNTDSIYNAKFPAVEEKYLVENSFSYPVSINGKVRAQVELALTMEQEEVKQHILGLESVIKWTNGAEPKKFIFVKGKIINVVV